MAAAGNSSSRLALIWVVGLFVAACVGDPGSELTLRLHNKTDRSARVVVPAVVPSQKAPPKETRGIDTVLAPGHVQELRLVMGLGEYAETVRAYADDRLIFCQKYRFDVSPRSSARYSVEIVEGHIAEQCADPSAAQ